MNLRTWVPTPLLSLFLLITWLVLARSVSPGQLFLGLALALAVPVVTSRLLPANVRLRRPGVLVAYVLRVMGDVVLSNLAVAVDIVRWKTPRSRFVVIPLDLQDPVGLAALALVTTIVPGTVWSELAVDRSSLLLHVWDVVDEERFVARFKSRYEQPLRQIFE